ncbi:MAG: DNA invertase Pin-like site-specific DNA recombinase [Saprospiraceae bacterium]|jgi:DNA invertase Pin-like site-specific DNA recombinase
MFHMMGAFAEFERDLIIERTTDGLASARARGRVGGRPKGLSPAAKQKASIASALYKEGRLSVAEICGQIGISKPTLYKYLKGRNVILGSCF